MEPILSLLNAIPSSVYVVLGVLLAGGGIYLRGKKKAAKEIAGEIAQVQLENIQAYAQHEDKREAETHAKVEAINTELKRKVEPPYIPKEVEAFIRNAPPPTSEDD